MTAATLTLTEFLLARIAEDEAVATAATDTRWRQGPFPHDHVITGAASTLRVAEAYADAASVAVHIARHDPARVLAECEAKRRIVGRGGSECSGYADQEEFGGHHYPDPAWSFCDGCSAAATADSDWLQTLQLLALPYADHPDYRPEWRPAT